MSVIYRLRASWGKQGTVLIWQIHIVSIRRASAIPFLIFQAAAAAAAQGCNPTAETITMSLPSLSLFDQQQDFTGALANAETQRQRLGLNYQNPYRDSD